MAITAFASSQALELEELEQAPVRYPRPSALGVALKLPGARAQHAAEQLGLRTVGDLLVHLPRDRRQARTVAELIAGESATVLVEVRSISSRSVRRRGMRPLVEATVADDTGSMKVTFFNQPWLAASTPRGHGSCSMVAIRREIASRCRRMLGRRRRSRAPRRLPTTRPPRASPQPRSSRS